MAWTIGRRVHGKWQCRWRYGDPDEVQAKLQQQKEKAREGAEAGPICFTVPVCGCSYADGSRSSADNCETWLFCFIRLLWVRAARSIWPCSINMNRCYSGNCWLSMSGPTSVPGSAVSSLRSNNEPREAVDVLLLSVLPCPATATVSKVVRALGWKLKAHGVC